MHTSADGKLMFWKEASERTNSSCINFDHSCSAGRCIRYWRKKRPHTHTHTIQDHKVLTNRQQSNSKWSAKCTRAEFSLESHCLVWTNCVVIPASFPNCFFARAPSRSFRNCYDVCYCKIVLLVAKVRSWRDPWHAKMILWSYATLPRKSRFKTDQ